MSDTIFRVHPTINFARVGNSEDYYIAPETAAGELQDSETGLFGGLPIKPGTEDTPIDSTDFRDSEQKVKRQAARFRVFAYDAQQECYPSSDPGREIKIGDTVGGKTVKDIVWTVHLANKKNNFYQITSANGEEEGILAYEGINPDTGKPNHPPVRDPDFGDDLASETRLSQLIIDPGPRTIKSSAPVTDVVNFNAATTSSYGDARNAKVVQQAPNYPVSFPMDHFPHLYNYGAPIDTLGQLRIEAESGRLIVTGGYGRASGIETSDGNPPPLDGPIDNANWFDDTSDGSVNAIVVFDDETRATVVGGWVVATDPGYAPQTRNIVSTWDDIFNTWVEELKLIPSLYQNGYQSSYNASFYGDILPVFHGAFLQRWNTSLPSQAVNGHNYVAQISPSDNPSEKIPNFQGLIRDPNIAAEDDEGVKMPLSLGDAQKSFLSVSKTQYFLMMQWYQGKSVEAAPVLGDGEKLDRNALLNCLGGRYSPGIDLSFNVRDVNLYKQDWQGVTGPFRINEDPLDYSTATKGKAFLGVGYVPLQTAKVQPGDLCKFLAQPWHTDYNSCAVHEPDPNPRGNNTLYWSWPAQRPVQVYPASECTYDATNKVWNLGGQLFSVRGDGEGAANGTLTDYPQNQGRYQLYPDYLANWESVGFIIQGTQIKSLDGKPVEGGDMGSDKFLEVASCFTSMGNVVQPWPTSVIPMRPKK